MIKEITQYIANELSSDFTIGTNLFPFFRTASQVDDCTVIVETPGGSVSFYLPDYANKMIQVITRGANYETARDLHQQIYELLHGKAGVELPVVDAGPAYLAAVIEATSAPSFLGQDERGLFEFVTTYIFRIQSNT